METPLPTTSVATPMTTAGTGSALRNRQRNTSPSFPQPRPVLPTTQHTHVSQMMPRRDRQVAPAPPPSSTSGPPSSDTDPVVELSCTISTISSASPSTPPQPATQQHQQRLLSPPRGRTSSPSNRTPSASPTNIAKRSSAAAAAAAAADKERAPAPTPTDDQLTRAPTPTLQCVDEEGEEMECPELCMGKDNQSEAGSSSNAGLVISIEEDEPTFAAIGSSESFHTANGGSQRPMLFPAAQIDEVNRLLQLESSNLADSTGTLSPIPNATNGNTLIVEHDIVSAASSPGAMLTTEDVEDVEVQVAIVARRESGTLIHSHSGSHQSLQQQGEQPLHVVDEHHENIGDPPTRASTDEEREIMIRTSSRQPAGSSGTRSTGTGEEGSSVASSTYVSASGSANSSAFTPSVVVSSPSFGESRPLSSVATVNDEEAVAKVRDRGCSPPAAQAMLGVMGGAPGWRSTLSRATTDLVSNTHERLRSISGALAGKLGVAGEGEEELSTGGGQQSRRNSSTSQASSGHSGEASAFKAFMGPSGMWMSLEAKGEARHKDLWKPDSLATCCDYPRCPVTFSILQRRHHCRACGQIFCEPHSSYGLPLFYPPSGTDSSGKGKVRMSRVCTTCNDQLTNPDEAVDPYKAAYSRRPSIAEADDEAGVAEVSYAPTLDVAGSGRPPMRRLFSAPVTPRSESPVSVRSPQGPPSFPSTINNPFASPRSASSARRTKSVRSNNPRTRVYSNVLARQVSMPGFAGEDQTTPRPALSPSGDIFNGQASNLPSTGYFPPQPVPYLPGEEPSPTVPGALAAYPLAHKPTTSSPFASAVGSQTSLTSLVPLGSSGGSSSRSGSRAPNMRISNMPSGFQPQDWRTSTTGSSGLLTPENEFIPENWGYTRETFDPDMDSSDDEGGDGSQAGLYARGRANHKPKAKSTLVVDGDFRFKAKSPDIVKPPTEQYSSSPAWATF